MTPCQKLGYNVGDRFKVKSIRGSFTKDSKIELLRDDKTDCPLFKLIVGHCHYNSTDAVPEAYTYLDNIEKIEDTNKYARTIHEVEVDVYDVLVAWNVTCPATQHAIKKLLMPGQRGSKDKLQDLQEAEQAIERAIELNR
jgi:hypothetical protein